MPKKTGCVFEKLTKGIQALLGGREEEGSQPQEAPREFHSQQARLKVEQTEQAIHLTPDFAGVPLLRLRGQLAGMVSSVRGEAGGRPAVLLSFPVFAEGQNDRVQVTAVHHGPGLPGESHKLIRATRRRIPEGQAVEVTYAEGDDQMRYLVEMPLRLEVEDFEEYSETQPVFQEVPPVSQMIAFLKATIHHRRTALRSLGAMARRCNHAQLRPVVELMEERLSQGHDFTNRGISLAREYLEQRGRTVYPNTVAALCLLADIFLGKLTGEQIEGLVEDQVPLETSPEAARAVAAFFGLGGTSREWKNLLPAGMKTARWRDSRKAADFLKGALGQRTALTILQDLAEDSGSERSRSRVARLLTRVAVDQVLVNDEHLALCEYLTALERSMQPDTVAAMGIYVDFEAGILSEEDIDGLTPQRAFWDTSLYGMVAISGAFDCELSAFQLPEQRTDRRWAQLGRMVELAEGGVIARFLEKGQPGYTTLFLDSPEDVERCRKKGLRFTGEVLARLPIIGYLNEPDLEALWGAGKSVIACFGSEDKRVQWRRLSRTRLKHELLEELLKGEFSFIDGYQIFNFYYSILASIVEIEPDSLQGASNVVVVYRDQRGNAQFQHFPLVESAEDLTAAPQHGWEWLHEVVYFPDLTGFPPVLHQLSHDALLGRPDVGGAGESRLDRVYEGLHEHLAHPWHFRPLSEHPRRLEGVRQGIGLSVFSSVLVGVVDTEARERLADILRDDSLLEVMVWEPLLHALDIPEARELCCLATLYGLCSSSEVPPSAIQDGEKFLELLLDRLYALADSEDPAHRIVSCRLLGSGLAAADEERRLSTSYLLARILEHDRVAVSRNAARSLAALALSPALALPEPVRIERKGDVSVDGPRPLEVGTEEVDRLLTQVDDLLGEFEEEPSWATPERLAAVCGLVQVLNQAFRTDRSGAEAGFLLTARAVDVARLYAATLGSWTAFSTLFELELPVLLSNAEPSQLLDSYLEALPQLMKLEGLELPVLGGGQAWYTAYRMPAGQGIELSEGLPSFFVHLAREVVPERPEAVSILRWTPLDDQDPGPGEQVALETPLHPHQLEVFAPRHGGYIPFLSPEAGPPDHKLELEAMRTLFQPMRTTAVTTEVPPDFQKLTDEVIRLFNLPPEQRRATLHMLVGLFTRREEPRAREPVAPRKPRRAPPPTVEPEPRPEVETPESPPLVEVTVPAVVSAEPPEDPGLEQKLREALERAQRAEQALEQTRAALGRLERAAEAEETVGLEDALTGLPTLSVMERYLDFTLEQVARYKRTTALLFVSIDDFQRLVGSLGARAGDELLVAVTGRLGEAVRSSDVLGRAGLGEFVVLLSELSDWDEATALISIVIARIREFMDPPLEISGQELNLTLSIGVSLCSGQGHTVEEQLSCARQAMERARELGGNQHHFYTESLQERHETRLTLEYELWNALDNHEFLVLYQPVVELASGEVVGLEALVRWEHPERGLLGPVDFLEAAERTGFVVPLGRWVFSRTVEDLSRWRERDLPLWLGINLSDRQLLQANLADSLASALRDHDVPASCVSLELSERSYEADPGRFERALGALSDLGCRTVLDHFGTGRSRWSDLGDGRFSALKIDRRFVIAIPEDRQAISLCFGAVAAAKALGVRPVAVGIERLEQLRFLQGVGCDLGQGTFLADPAPAERIPELVRKGLRL